MSSRSSNNSKKSRHPVLLLTAAFTLLFTAAAGAFVYYQMVRYEDGLLDVCATQQDGYVQLVVDQINLKSNRDNEEIITDILGTLDASSNKYWTFSRDQAMLFVKDVLETNKYKGFTTATYYVSDSAREFLETLKQDRVPHSQIEHGGQKIHLGPQEVVVVQQHASVGQQTQAVGSSLIGESHPRGNILLEEADGTCGSES